MRIDIFIVLCYFRIEISDNGRSEGSEDSLPNETSVKFISEVSSKVSGVLQAYLYRPSLKNIISFVMIHDRCYLLPISVFLNKHKDPEIPC